MPAQEHLDPDDQLFRCERLQYVVVAATAQSGNPVVEVCQCAQHQNRCPEPRVTHGLGDLQPVAARQHPVQGDDVEAAAQSESQALRAIETRLRQEAAPRQAGCNGSSHFDVVLDYQNPGRRRAR
jgi:hypothetical protein